MPRDSNPFDEENVNPFAKNAGTGAKSWLPTMSSSPRGFTSKDDANVNVPMYVNSSPMDPKQKEKDIAAWEADLKRKEDELKRREDALANAGFVVEEKNWPTFFPIIHHDIAKEIPINAQRMQYLAFASWLGVILCLVWNLVAVIACWISGEGVKIFLLATIYALSGCPLSYMLWYKPLYSAMRTDSMMHFGWFFLVYLFHIGFCIFAAIAPPIIVEEKSFTGFIAALGTFSDSAVVGIFYLIGSCLFSLETLLSVLVLQKIYMYFRGNK